MTAMSPHLCGSEVANRVYRTGIGMKDSSVPRRAHGQRLLSRQTCRNSDKTSGCKVVWVYRNVAPALIAKSVN